MDESDRCAGLERELVETRRRLARAESELSTIKTIMLTAMEQAPVGFLILDSPTMTVRMVSLEGLGIIGKDGTPTRDVTIEEYLRDWQLLHPDGTPYEVGHRPIVQAIREGTTLTNVETIVRGADGVERAVAANAAPVRNEAGEIVGGVVVFQDVTPLKALEAERAQTLSFFAHDMKSPLFGAVSFLERLLAGKVGRLDTRQEEYLRTITGLVKRVLSLTVDFLDVARLGKAGAPLLKASIDVEAILDKLEAEFKERAYCKGLVLAFDIERPLPRVTGDEQRITRALANLLDNAIKFSSTGKVELRAFSPAPGLELTVEVLDRGPGLSSEDLANLFNPFYRGEAGKGVEGTGLGLAAVRAIVQAHGGRITGENRAGGGSCFHITLPIETGSPEE